MGCAHVCGARNILRLADHCSNIGVAVIESEDEIPGANQYIKGLREKHTDKFNDYYREYVERFSI